MRRTDEDAGPTPVPWWSHPVVGLCLFALPGVGLALLVPEPTFVEAWGMAKHVGLPHAVLAVLAIVAFAAGAAWFGLVSGDRTAPAPATSVPTGPETWQLVRVHRALVAVALLGYAAWGAIAVTRGVRLANLQAVLAGQPSASYDLKQLMAPVAGITTLTQVAPIVGALAGMLAARGELPLVRRPAALLLSLAVLRGFFLSERLAILEVVLPAMVAYFLAARSTRGRRGVMGRLRSWFPLVYVAGAASVFLAFEFNRSWAYYRQTRSGGYVEFALDRFTGYYTTSVNNAALLHDGMIGARPQLFSLQWLVDFPVIGSLTGLGEDRLPLNELLVGSGNPEFNTEGALLAPTIDFGLIPSLFVWFALGVVALAVHRRVRRGEHCWVPLYAAMYVGILESGRYFYWGLGRAFVPMVTGLLVVRYLHSERESAEVPPPPVPVDG